MRLIEHLLSLSIATLDAPCISGQRPYERGEAIQIYHEIPFWEAESPDLGEAYAILLAGGISDK